MPKAASSESSENSGSGPAMGSKNQAKGWWRPQDIFDPENWPEEDLDGLAGDQGSEAEPLVSAVDEEDGRANESVEALDEAAIAAQLVSFTAEAYRQILQHVLFFAYQEMPNAMNEREDLADTAFEQPERSHLRSHYLPFLFAAKALSSDASHCHNSTCMKTFDHKLPCLQLWRCRSCFGGKGICTSCLRESHQDQPFHVVEAWETREFTLERSSERWAESFPQQFGFFARRSLKDAGLEVGLGHQGQLCPQTSNRDGFDMTILHVNGQHSVTFRPCACSSKEKWELLLEAGIFPATEAAPQTGFTLELLEHFQEFSLRAKVNLREYYQAIVGLTNRADLKGARGVSVCACFLLKLEV